jgi:hypothetical protein
MDSPSKKSSSKIEEKQKQKSAADPPKNKTSKTVVEPDIKDESYSPPTAAKRNGKPTSSPASNRMETKVKSPPAAV